MLLLRARLARLKAMETVKTSKFVISLLQDSQDDKTDAQDGSSSHRSADGGTVITCIICNSKMIDIQACHMFCPVCGSHLDCSDKGSFW